MDKFLVLILSLGLVFPAFAQDDQDEPTDPYADGWREKLPRMPKGWSTDGQGCLVMKDYAKETRNPWGRAPKIPMSGKLAVTYVHPDKDPAQGDTHEVGVVDYSRSPASLELLTDNYLNESEVEFSPDGKKMLFTLRGQLDDFESTSSIYLLDLERPRCGTKCGPGQEDNPKLLVGGVPVGVPAWHHPHGDKFTYIEWGNADKNSRFFTYDMKTGTSTPFAEHIQNIADPEVSYDGKFITFKMSQPGDRSNQPSIFIMNSDGTGLRRLTGNGYVYSDHDPVFSRDGKKIYFERYYGPYDWFWASHRRGDAEWYNWWGIVEVDVRTRREKVIAPPDPCGKHFFWLPTVSPDGKHVMYAHVDVWAELPKAWTDLWVSDIDGGRPQLVPGSEWFYFFDWSH